MTAESFVVPNQLDENCSYDYITENPDFEHMGSGRLQLQFVKCSRSERHRDVEDPIKQLEQAEHFVVLVYRQGHTLQSAPSIDQIHLLFHNGYQVRIHVEQTAWADPDFEELRESPLTKMYGHCHAIEKRSYAELIEFVKRKDAQRSRYSKVTNNCHKFCIEFANFCGVSSDEIRFTKMEGCFYGCVNAAHCCQYCLLSYPSTVFLDDFHRRTCIYSCMYFLFCVMSFAWWVQTQAETNTDVNIFRGPFASCATGAFFIFFASISSFLIGIGEIKVTDGKCCKIWVNCTAVLYCVGGICYWFGGCAVTSAFDRKLQPVCDHTAFTHAGYCSAFAGVWFVETTAVGVSAISVGIDVWNMILSNSAIRKYFNLGLLAFVSLVGFFCFAILSTNLKRIAYDNGRSSLGAVAAAYFFIFCICVFHIGCRIVQRINHFRINSREHVTGAQALDLVCIPFFGFFSLILCIGYWALSSMESASIESAVLSGIKHLNHEYLRVYWVGISFFWVGFLFLCACDIQIGRFFALFVKIKVED